MHSVKLAAGSHAADSRAMCAMEATAFLMGLPHSDHPPCTCPVIAAFVRQWNDDLPSDAERARILGPRLLDWVGTRATPAIEDQREWMCVDYLARDHLPRFLRLVPELRQHADACAALQPLCAVRSADAALPTLNAAKNAARAAWAASVVRAANAASAVSAANAASAVSAAWADFGRAVSESQDSALALLDRMIALTPQPKEVVATRSTRELCELVGTCQ